MIEKRERGKSSSTSKRRKCVRKKNKCEFHP